METPSRHSYNLDGSTRVFPIASPIKGDNYCRVEIDGVYITDRSLYDIVNNSIVFVSATTVPNGSVLDVLVVQSEEAIGLLGTTTNVDIVAQDIDNVNIVAADIDNVNTVAADIANVNTVAGDIANVNTVATNLSDITNFSAVYLGAKSTDPALRNDGSALEAGDLYFNTTINELSVYTGSFWGKTSGAAITVDTFTLAGSLALTLSVVPSDKNKTSVTINGITQHKSSYSLSGAVLTLDAGEVGDAVEVTTIESSPVINTGSIVVDNFVGDGSTVVFNIGNQAGDKKNTQVYIDGTYQNKDGYTLAGTTLTFSEAPPLNSPIEVVTQLTYALGETASNQVSHIAAGTGATSRTVQAKLRETVSVKDFGAVGDGVTDDTSAIQAALDSGATVIDFGDSTDTYLLSCDDDGLSVTDAACLTVSTEGMLLKGSAVLKRDANVHAHGIFVTADNVTIDGLQINGNRSNNDLSGSNVHVADGIKVKDADYVTVKNCELYDSVGKGINYDGTYYGAITFNTIKNSARSAIQVASSGSRACSYNKIHFNQINGTDDGEYANGIFLSQSHDSTSKNLTGYYNSIVGNIVLNAGDWGIESGYRCFYTTIANNTIEKSYAVGIGCRDNRGTIISANNIELNIAGSTGQMIGIQVDAYQMGISDTYGVPVADVVVSANTIRAFTNNGINVKNAKNVHIADNSVVGRGTSYGVGLNNLSSRVSWSNNRVDNCQTGMRLNVADLSSCDLVEFNRNYISNVSEGLKLEAIDINDCSFSYNTLSTSTTPIIDNGASVWNSRFTGVFDVDKPYSWTTSFNGFSLSADGFQRTLSGTQFSSQTIFGVKKPALFKIRVGDEFPALVMITGDATTPTVTVLQASASIGDSGSGLDFRIEVSGSNIVIKQYAVSTTFTSFIVEVC